MTRSTFCKTALPALALALGVAFALPAAAQPADSAAPAAKERARGDNPGKKWGRERGEHPGKGERGEGPRGFGLPSAEELGKLEAMTPEQRHEYMQEKRKKWQGMSDEEKKAAHEKARASFEAMTPEQRAAMKERHMKLTEQWKADMQKKFDSMPPEEQAAAKERMRQRMEERRAKWGEQGRKEGREGKKRGEYRKGDKGGKEAKPAEEKPAAE